MKQNKNRRRLSITRAICRQTDGSQTDGKKLLQLPFPVMRFDINFPAINQPEVASDTDPFTRLFLTYYCKALSRACFGEYNFHNFERFNVESKGRLKEYSIRFISKKQGIYSKWNKCPVVLQARELALSRVKLYSRCKYTHFLSLSKLFVKPICVATGKIIQSRGISVRQKLISCMKSFENASLYGKTPL